MEYLSQHPTSSTILAAVHGVKAKSRLKWKDIDPNRLESEFSTLPQMLDQAPVKLDDGFKESMDYANKLLSEMKDKSKLN